MEPDRQMDVQDDLSEIRALIRRQFESVSRTARQPADGAAFGSVVLAVAE
jgi:hypothetical protein